ncbi:MAG: hypothetical protein HYU36_24940 [Planctomycetes bacterium]|nr:hypothetical protein [Planctomycetota bacterium]
MSDKKQHPLNRVQKEVVEEIKGLHKKREALNILAVQRFFPGLLRKAYSIKPFWGWKRALEAAGLNYSKIRVELEPYCECKICGFLGKNLVSHLVRKHETHPREYRTTYPGADLFSEELRARMSEWLRDRFPPSRPHWEPLWSPGYVLDRAAWLAETGTNLNTKAVVEIDTSLWVYGVYYFKGWDNVLRKIGLNPRKVRLIDVKKHLSPEEVVRQLKARQRLGIPLNTRAVGLDDLRLLNAMRRRFGSHDAASERVLARCRCSQHAVLSLLKFKSAGNCAFPSITAV